MYVCVCIEFLPSSVILTFIHVLLPSTGETYNFRSINIDSSAGIKVSYVFPKCPHSRHSQKANNFQTTKLQRGFHRFDVDDKSVHIYTRKLNEEYEKWGFTINLEKTKYICIGEEKESLKFDSGEEIK
jgi:hypothetical protein